MKILLQRVSSASVTVAGESVGQIGAGYLALVGCRTGDLPEDADRLAARTAALRVFEDAEGRMNRSVADVGGAVLAISQFTLYADTRKGNRPSFVEAGDPAAAERLYERFCADLRSLLGPVRVATGRFGADMRVALVNEGPCTIGLRSEVAVEPTASPRPRILAPALAFEAAETDGQCARVRAVADAAWPLTYGELLPPGQIAYMLDWMYAPAAIREQSAAGTPFLLVRADGRDAGVLSLDLRPAPDGSAELHKLYLRPEYWGRGIGALVLAEACERARAAGATSLWLRVNKRNERAQKAYRAAGFRRARALTTDIGGGFVMDDFVYERPL